MNKTIELTENIKNQLAESLKKEFPFEDKYITSFMEIIDYMAEYDRERMYDELHERADNLTLIYNYDLVNWLAKDEWNYYNKIDYMNKSVEEGLIDFTKYEFFRHVMAANYLYHFDKLSIIANSTEGFFENLEINEEEEEEN